MPRPRHTKRNRRSDAERGIVRLPAEYLQQTQALGIQDDPSEWSQVLLEGMQFLRDRPELRQRLQQRSLDPDDSWFWTMQGVATDPIPVALDDLAASAAMIAGVVVRTHGRGTAPAREPTAAE